jgi:hypothetical protein
MSEDRSIREIAEECDDCEVKSMSYNDAKDLGRRSDDMDRMDVEASHRNGVSIDACEEHDPQFLAMADEVIR